MTTPEEINDKEVVLMMTICRLLGKKVGVRDVQTAYKESRSEFIGYDQLIERPNLDRQT